VKFADDIVFGRKPVEELLGTNRTIDKILLEQKMSGPFEKEIRQYAKNNKIPLSKVPQNKLDKLSGFKNHQGIVVFTTAIQFYELEDVLQHSFEQGKVPFFLILDNITDVRNIGAIARSAHWFGVDAIVYSLKNAAALNSTAVKISAGALLELPVCRVSSIIKALEYLKQSGLQIVGTDVSKETFSKKEAFIGPLAIVMGSEEKGMSREVSALCDALMHIPGKGNIDSLNVSVATGVVLYEVFKTRTEQ